MLKPQTHYHNSKGDYVDPKDMATPHLQSALRKAERDGHHENVQVLQEELSRRESNTPSL